MNGMEKVKDKVKEKLRKQRSAEIWSVFAKHNFYVNGFDPKELRTTLEDLGPTYVKMGQIMSSRSDILPEKYCIELAKLRSEVAPMDASAARAVIEEETGKRIDEIYSEFRDEPIGSASVAQAHYGVLKDGTRVVTKVQRPEIAEMMRRDFVLLKKLASAVNVAVEADNSLGVLDFHSVLKELENVTEEELDFRIEAENTRVFRENCIEDDSVISCPTVIDELSTERILTMTYVDGFSIANKERVDSAGWDRQAIGKAIIENYMHQVLDVGIFHADPHQGNIMIRNNGVPCWIDFGMIGRVSDRSINVIQSMITSVLKKDAESLANSALSIATVRGKVNKTKLTEDLNSLLERYASFTSIDELDLGKVLTDLTKTMAEHRITMPGEYTLLTRSLITLEGVIDDFCPELNLISFLSDKMLERARANFDLRSKVADVLGSIASTGVKTFHLPATISDVLQTLTKGRMKINFELTGYDDFMKRINTTVKDVILAAFSCVLFSGSCRLCVADIQPKLDGIPVFALIGFVVSIALGIYTICSVAKNRNKD